MNLEDIKLSWYHIAIPVILILFCPVIFLSIRQSTSPSIIAIPANEPSLLSPVAPVFSRAPFFIVYDMKNNKAKYLVNNFANATYKAGLQVTHLLLKEKVGVVIAKNVGPEPYGHLTKRGVAVYDGLAMNVQEAVYKYQNNMLIKTKGPTGFSKIFSQV